MEIPQNLSQIFCHLWQTCGKSGIENPENGLFPGYNR